MSRLLSFWRGRHDADSFEACVAPHMERLWRLALRLQGRPADAEDLVQETLARAWRHRADVLALDAPGPWLARVLTRMHVDRWRRRNALDAAESLPDPDRAVIEADTKETSSLATVSAEEVLAAVRALPDRWRLPVLLHDAEGYSLEEIGRMLGIPVGTLKSRLHRARSAVRKSFGDGT